MESEENGMSAILINGGNPLSGAIRLQGAKNSSLPILAASLLAKGPCQINNCPDLLDIDISLEILSLLGCKAKRAGGAVVADTSGMNAYEIPDGLTRKMRSSIVFLGGILAMAGEAVISHPGGCQIGERPIDLHVSALKQMGVNIREEGVRLYCKADRLTGCDIHFHFPSVGATQNIMLAAARAKGTTRIFNAAMEPEIEDLQNFLNSMGARVRGAGCSVVIIEGVERMRGTEHTVIPDRIVASTLLASLAAAGGDISLTGARPDDLTPVISVLREAGCEITAERSSIRAKRTGRLRSMGQILTMPHPGFPTDAQALVMAASCTSQGATIFKETVFESRYTHVGELHRMGADIQVHGRVAVVQGVEKLYGAKVEATDLRAGAALATAALGAEGETEITCTGHIDRGYEKLEDMLASLGADAKRVAS
jgi:UDP-N-acetylglucosamine 1-carboxyvinyltransferase